MVGGRCWRWFNKDGEQTGRELGGIRKRVRRDCWPRMVRVEKGWYGR